MNLWIVGIVELLQQESIGSKRSDNLFRLANGTSHSLGGRSQNHVCTKGLEKNTTLHGHAFRHCQNKLVALCRSHHGQSNTSISCQNNSVSDSQVVCIMLHHIYIVLPDVGSTRVVRPGSMSPRFSASPIMDRAMRSLTELAGLEDSSLATISATHPSVTLLSLTRGVLPMSSKMLLAMFSFNATLLLVLRGVTNAHVVARGGNEAEQGRELHGRRRGSKVSLWCEWWTRTVHKSQVDGVTWWAQFHHRGRRTRKKCRCVGCSTMSRSLPLPSVHPLGCHYATTTEQLPQPNAWEWIFSGTA